MRDVAFFGRAALAVVLGVALVSLCAQVSIPTEPVPITLQTAGVLLVGGLLGPWLGLLAMLLYIQAALLGLPVLADGAALEPLEAFQSLSIGYIVGFVPGAFVAGLAAPRGSSPSTRRVLVVMQLAHVPILLLGAARLTLTFGVRGAIEIGVFPYLVGAFAKGLIAGGLVLLWVRLFRAPAPRATAREDVASAAR